MSTPAQIQSMLDSIEAAIAGNARGVKSREIRGRRIEFMTLPELMQARSQLQAELARAQGGSRFNVASFGTPGRGGGR